MDYLWVKAFHIISVMSWMAGLLYLPRLFVYHAAVEPGSVRAHTFILMERRLLKAIMTPAMISSWALGLWMIYLDLSILEQPWMVVKLICVVMMTATHMVFVWMRKELEKNHPLKGWAYRISNEVPTLLMMIIIIMAVVQPF